MLPTRILLIDDHALFRAGLRMVLATGIPDVQVLEAASLEEAMRLPAEPLALVLLDVQLQGLNGLEGIALVQRKWPGVVVVVLSSQAEPQTVRQALARGATAFVSKADTPEHILSMVDKLLLGLPVATLAYAGMGAGSDAGTPPRLTPRQCEVLNLVSQGLSNKLIGRRLDLSENTVRGHVQALLAALQVSSRSEAGFVARRSGLVD
ncbi:response regulator transcription factor [Variovorax sp. J22G21]|uniref:response regulator n=1 Tax=Variovorax fucosicus TaxID=3053517 RepID=UPI002578087A|nr:MULTISPECIES: response regulator transcription factor [unclassified Variovorax]MDM0039677.1 response regulator transcription factor [Variovorax sp. J22R193]MDM0054712.1 response regulator transcription factor [Variovorax sp. J22G47]MDM0064452.1 response regulator transcription factor [Variovorax sp. J22G21]